jgi:hypothetical protein
MSGDSESRPPAGWYSAKSGLLAVLLTVMWIGAGHLYAGAGGMKPVRLMMVYPAIFIFGLIVFPYGFALLPLAVVWASVDAVGDVKAWNADLNIR